MKCGRRVEKTVKRRGWWQVYFLVDKAGSLIGCTSLPATDDQHSEKLDFDGDKSGTVA